MLVECEGTPAPRLQGMLYGTTCMPQTHHAVLGFLLSWCRSVMICHRAVSCAVCLLLSAAARAVSPAPPVIHHQKPKTFTEALQQLEVLHQAVANHQQQLLDQNQKAAQRAQDAHQAFNRQLQTEKVQLVSERKKSELLMCEVEQQRERLAQAEANCVQLEQQLEALQDELEEARAAGSSSSGSASHITQLQWRLQEKQTALISLQEAVQELLGRLKAAGRPVDAAALSAAGQKGGAMKQLEAAVQQLLADVTSQAALLEQQHQQRQGQQAQGGDAAALRQQLEAAQQEVAQLQEQYAHLQRTEAEKEAALQQAIEWQLGVEQKLLSVTQLNQRKEALKQQVQRQQQQLQQQSMRLEGDRVELDKAIQDRAALAAHLEECRQQLADSNQQLAQRTQQLAELAAEREVLHDRIREFADRQTSCRSSGAELFSSSSGRAGRFGSSSRGNPLHDSSSSSSPNSMSPEAQQMLSVACAELNQKVAVLEQQLGESHAKQDRLQLVNAQLQERLSAMQVSCYSLLLCVGVEVWVGGCTLACACAHWCAVRLAAGCTMRHMHVGQRTLWKAVTRVVL